MKICLHYINQEQEKRGWGKSETAWVYFLLEGSRDCESCDGRDVECKFYDGIVFDKPSGLK